MPSRTPEMVALDRSITLVGGVTALAEAIGMGQSTVSNWRARGRVPSDYAPAIERAVDAALAAGAAGERVTCEQLCPWVEWSYLRQQSRREPCPNHLPL